jgi:hypothetical protein
MKRILKTLGAMLLIATFVGCSDEQNTISNPTSPGRLVGTVSLQEGPAEALDGTQIMLYRTDIAINTQIPSRIAVTDESGYFEADDVCCGQYLVVAWKDNNVDGFVGSGDFYTTAAVGSSCNCRIDPGKTTTICHAMAKLK